MSIPKKYVKTNLDRLFIAYSSVYIDNAVKALNESPKAEAVIIQPYIKDKNFPSTLEALMLYKELKGQDGIPILFTPQGRMANEGQYFEYGSRLLDVMDMTVKGVREIIEEKREKGIWVYQSEDSLYSVKNVLIVKAPIVLLHTKLPIEDALNILRPKQGEPTKAIAIPAPKLIKVGYEKILKSL